MFQVVEDKTEIADFQRQLERAIRKALPKRSHRDIGYPSDTLRDAPISSDGTHWYHTREHRDGRRRWLNWFGFLAAKRGLQISVEINVPVQGRDDMVSGFFVRDSQTGRTFLAHSGRVGGGHKGVGRTGFLAWSDQRLIDAEASTGKPRQGILVMALDGSPSSVLGLLRYVDSIARYKAAVRAGETNTPAFRRKAKRYADFYEEGRGRRRGHRTSDIDYVSRHGDIVSALNLWREAASLPKGGRIVKDILIDLGVEVRGQLTELYEAKSSADRPSIYAAIGQLFVHGAFENCRRVVVLPHDEPLANDLAEALSRLKIAILRFRFKSLGADILG